MFLERKANSIDKVKLTIKFIKPIKPIPRTDQNKVQKSRLKKLPYNPRAKFPLANVMCLMSKLSPKNIPIDAVLPKKTPNHILEITPAQLLSTQVDIFFVLIIPKVCFKNGFS